MGFFTFEVVSSEEKKLAVKLYEIIYKARRINQRPNFTKWASEFRKLTKQGISISEITKTLDWLAQNITDKYTPKIYGAGGFVLKYEQLQEAIKRQPAPTPKVTPAARLIVENLGLIWPNFVSLESVLVCAQTTLDNYYEYVQKLKRFATEHKQTTDNNMRRMVRLAEYVYDLQSSPAKFTDQWLVRIHRFLWRAKGKRYRVDSWGMSISNPIFLDSQRQLSYEYCNDDNLIMSLMELLYEGRA